MMYDICSVSFDFMEKGELQRMCHELFENFEDLQRLKNFEIENEGFITKIKSLEDALMK